MTKRELIGNIVAEFAPVTSFLIVSEVWDFRAGLMNLIAVATCAFMLSWKIERRVPKFGLIASGTILFFGILSLLTGNEFYIIIKDTLYALAFGSMLLLGLLFGRSYLESLFGDFFAVSDAGWRTITIRWTVFFFLLALGNEIARRIFVPETWVVYKFIAVLATWVFGFYQFTVLRKERLPGATKWGFRIRDQVAEAQ